MFVKNLQVGGKRPITITEYYEILGNTDPTTTHGSAKIKSETRNGIFDFQDVRSMDWFVTIELLPVSGLWSFFKISRSAFSVNGPSRSRLRSSSSSGFNWLFAGESIWAV